ncbi:HAD family hydrolase [soil metagenome]
MFFDAGETILHPHPSFPELFSAVCGRNGVDVPTEQVRAVQERLAPHLVDLGEATGVEKPSLSPEGSRTFWTYLYRRLLGELGIEDESLVGELYGTFSHVSSYKLFDDVLPVLAELEKRGHRLGLISNFERWLEEMLVELEVGDLFDVTVISGLEGMEKPDPAIYEVALERAEVEPGRAVHVGDSPVMDVVPASSVGMATVLVDRAGRYPDAEGHRVGSLTELPDLVATL